jgi:phage gpG-like protein
VAVEFASTLNSLSALVERVRAQVADGVQEGAEVLKEQVQENLSASHYPPVSEPGTPPAYRTGYLHDSVFTMYAPTETGAYGEVWPSTVYARIHELSGWAGRGHRSFLPKRPYVEPARDEQADHIRQIIAARVAQALGG